jgi:hypothetical protein
VALWEVGRPVPLRVWLDRHWRLAARMHALHLSGVGSPTDDVREEGGIAWHLRRVCTPDEIATLTRRGAWPRPGGAA